MPAAPRRTRRTAALAFTAALALVLSAPPATAAPAASHPHRPKTVSVRVIGLNDFHGNLEAPGGSSGRVTLPDGNTVNAGGAAYLATHVKQLRADGMTVMFVEHDMDVVHDISDWVIVMGEGRVIAEGTPDQISSNDAVIDAYLGAHHDAPLTAAEEEAQLEEIHALIEEELGETDG